MQGRWPPIECRCPGRVRGNTEGILINTLDALIWAASPAARTSYEITTQPAHLDSDQGCEHARAEIPVPAFAPESAARREIVAKA
jgi:hypothetical protein